MTAIILMVAALIQWLGVGERIYHGIWQWYKFSGYSDDGYTSISYTMAAFTFAASLGLILLGITVYKFSEEKLISKMAAISASALSLGMAGLVILLASPVGSLALR